MSLRTWARTASLSLPKTLSKSARGHFAWVPRQDFAAVCPLMTRGHGNARIAWIAATGKATATILHIGACNLAGVKLAGAFICCGVRT